MATPGGGLWLGLCLSAAGLAWADEPARLLFIGQDLRSIEGYVRATGHTPEGVMAYTSLQKLEGLEREADWGGGPQHARALLQRYPKAALQLGLWMVGASDDIVRGRYDDQIERLAAFLRSVKRPVYLRIGYEFDLDVNGYEPRAYVQAYRYLVEALKRRGVANVSYVWHSYAGDLGSPARWYPGDAYVDWCAISSFDQDASYFEPMADFARAHGKPLMVAEATPRGIGTGDPRLWAAWFRPLMRWMAAADVRALSYINADWETQPMFAGQGWQDARIEAHPQVHAEWFDGLARAGFFRGIRTPEAP